MREIYVCVTFKYYNLYFEVANCYKQYLPTFMRGLLLQIANRIIFYGSFQIYFNLEKNIEADIVFCIVSYSDGVLRHLNLYGVLELPGRKNAKSAYLNSNYSKMPEYFSEDFLLVNKS